MKAKDLMSSPVATIGPDTTVREIAALMLARSVSGLPVVDGDRVVGIASGASLATVSGGAEARARTTSARVTMPTSADPRSTGKRRMRCRSNRPTMDAASASSVTEMTPLVITSRAWTACDATYSAGLRSPASHRIHHLPSGARRSVPIS
jgi:CBS domain-containing protein